MIHVFPPRSHILRIQQLQVALYVLKGGFYIFFEAPKNETRLFSETFFLFKLQVRMVKGNVTKSPKKGDFYSWLRNYLKVNGQVNPIADLAADAQSDPSFPRGRGKTLEELKYYITTNFKPIPNAIIALENAFEMYSRE